VSTKWLTCLGRPRFSSATLMAVGSVALDEAVENAVTMASLQSRKNATGLRPPNTRTEIDYLLEKLPAIVEKLRALAPTPR